MVGSRAVDINTWVSYIESQARYLEHMKQGASKRMAPFVTISRQTGAGGITISDKLAGYLNQNLNKPSQWVVFDQNLIETVLREHNLPQEFAKFMPENRVSETKDMIEELFGLHPSEWALVHKTSETILHLAQMGNVILVGRGANMITKKFLLSGLHVRLVGSLKKRIQHVQDYYHLKPDAAADFVKKEDEGRKKYLKQNFDKDIEDPLLYDVIVNTDSISYDDAAQLIGDQLLRKAKQLSA